MPDGHTQALFAKGENAKPARTHGSGRIGRPEKAIALGESSLDRVVPESPSPARGVKRARVLSAFPPLENVPSAMFEARFRNLGTESHTISRRKVILETENSRLIIIW